jgi:hypothetical protein
VRKNRTEKGTKKRREAERGRAERGETEGREKGEGKKKIVNETKPCVSV